MQMIVYLSSLIVSDVIFIYEISSQTYFTSDSYFHLNSINLS